MLGAAFVINIKHLAQKCIINASVLYQLREQTAADVQDSQAYFLEKVDDLINDHLRGMDFKTRRLVRQELIKNYFNGNDSFEITYYDVANILISLDLPVVQIINNFQNWILMSTEYSLSSSEIAKLCLEEANEKTIEFQIAYEDSLPLVTFETPLENEVLKEAEVENLIDYENELYPEDFGEVLDEVDFVLTSTSDSDETIRRVKFKYNYKRIFIYVCGAVLLGSFAFIYSKTILSKNDIGFADASSLTNVESYRPANMKLIVRVIAARNSSGFPSFLGFSPINKERMQGYLKRKNSLLANEPYFSAIMHSAAVADVNPVLMFAIAGQEQGFVRRGSENAALIINNPFNVFSSWIEYNTNINDSSQIAAETIKNILSDREKGENPFQWLNKTYAEDPKWWIGVERIFLEIEEYLGPYDMEIIQ